MLSLCQPDALVKIGKLTLNFLLDHKGLRHVTLRSADPETFGHCYLCMIQFEHLVFVKEFLLLV